MTLLELCEPLFQYVCFFNRAARAGARHDLQRVRSEVKSILADMRDKSNTDAALAANFQQIELPLLCFVDSMVRSSPSAAGQRWSDLAAERGEESGDEEFFDLLDDALADPSQAAEARLAVFYTCMGLGFAGWYAGQPDYLRKKMLDCSTRLRHFIDADAAARLCPETYENVNTANLVQPPGVRLAGIGIALIGLIVVLLVVNAYLYRETSGELMNILKSIQEKMSRWVTMV